MNLKRRVWKISLNKHRMRGVSLRNARLVPLVEDGTTCELQKGLLQPHCTRNHAILSCKPWFIQTTQLIATVWVITGFYRDSGSWNLDKFYIHPRYSMKRTLQSLLSYTQRLSERWFRCLMLPRWIVRIYTISTSAEGWFILSQPKCPLCIVWERAVFLV